VRASRQVAVIRLGLGKRKDKPSPEKLEYLLRRSRSGIGGIIGGIIATRRHEIPPRSTRKEYAGARRGPASVKRRRRRGGREARTGGNGGRIPQESRGVERRAYGGVPRARLEALSV